MSNRNELGRMRRALARIERKCDAIIRRLDSTEADAVGNAIERMHSAASALREQSAAQRRALMDFLGI